MDEDDKTPDEATQLIHPLDAETTVAPLDAAAPRQLERRPKRALSRARALRDWQPPTAQPTQDEIDTERAQLEEIQPVPADPELNPLDHPAWASREHKVKSAHWVGAPESVDAVRRGLIELLQREGVLILDVDVE